jgi:hypothetical protein
MLPVISGGGGRSGPDLGGLAGPVGPKRTAGSPASMPTSRTLPTPSTSIVSPLTTFVTSCALAATQTASQITIGNTNPRAITA